VAPDGPAAPAGLPHRGRCLIAASAPASGGAAPAAAWRNQGLRQSLDTLGACQRPLPLAVDTASALRPAAIASHEAPPARSVSIRATIGQLAGAGYRILYRRAVRLKGGD
jgi:hypothetical protein